MENTMSKWQDKTAGGYPVRILCEDAPGMWSIVYLVDMGRSSWMTCKATSDGKACYGRGYSLVSAKDLPTSEDIEWPDFKWAAMDGNGQWNAYTEKPKFDIYVWYVRCGEYKQKIPTPPHSPPSDRWRETLIERK
jgi:hypothetical protein